jgi:hypothetical protein
VTGDSSGHLRVWDVREGVDISTPEACKASFKQVCVCMCVCACACACVCVCVCFLVVTARGAWSSEYTSSMLLVVLALHFCAAQWLP